LTTTENIKEIRSLLSLLDDPDEEVIRDVESVIVQRGASMIPWLEEARGLSSNPLVLIRIERVLHQIHFSITKDKLEKWMSMGQDNLLLGALIISKYQYPSLKEESIIRRLGHISQDIYLRIKEEMTPMEKVQVVNTVLFEDYEFYGNKRDYQSPQCYYLNMVFDTGRGNHISLGILYILVARSLGIPIVGVDLQEYFFLAYQEHDEMLFYVNPFSRGNTLSKSELLFFLKLAEVNVGMRYLNAINNTAILQKMVKGLSDAYGKLKKFDKVDELKQLEEILRSEKPNNP
jgi:regulator of sirC expression with transglutaminase-like and TPR domain